MGLYFIQSGESGPIKVGHSNSFDKRLKTLQVGHFEPLKLILAFSGAWYTIEEEFHYCAQTHHLRGEWFSSTMLDCADGFEAIFLDYIEKSKQLIADRKNYSLFTDHPKLNHLPDRINPLIWRWEADLQPRAKDSVESVNRDWLYKRYKTQGISNRFTQLYESKNHEDPV